MDNSQQSFIKDTLDAASKLLPPSSQKMREDFEKNLRALLEAQLRQMDLVSKEEFNANLQLVSRLTDRVAQLEQKVDALKKD